MNVNKKKYSIVYFKTDCPEIQYGINTFLNDLIPFIVQINRFSVYLVKYYEPTVEEFTVNTLSDNYTEIAIPSPLYYIKSHKNDQRYANRVVDLLTEFFSNTDIIVHANHFNDHDICKVLRERFAKLSIINSIHSMILENAFNGNKVRMANYVQETKYALNISFVNKEAALVQMSDYVVSVSNYHKNVLEQYYGVNKDKVQVIPRGLNIGSDFGEVIRNKESLRKDLYFDADDKVILYVGRINSSKGLKSLIGSLRILLKDHPRFRLVIVGSGDIESIFPYCVDIWSKISFTGFLSKTDLAKFFQLADVGVLPAVYENDSLISKEMILNRLPLIVSNCDGFSGFFEDQNNCIIIDNRYDVNGEPNLEEDELAMGILNITNNKVFSDLISEKAYVGLVGSGELNSTLSKYIDIYNDIQINHLDQVS